MILILLLKQWMKYLQISKPKSYKNFYRKCSKCKHQENYEDFHVAYSSEDVG